MKEPEAPYRSVFVTGGLGYVGRLLLAELVREPGPLRRIVCGDLREPAPAERLPGVEYAAADVRSADFCALFRRFGCDAVVHLAAIVTPGRDSSRALEYEVDVVGTERVLAGCLGAGVRKLIYASSGAAYGYHADSPEWLDEDDPLRGNPEFAYSDHKRQVEERLARARDEHPELLQLVLRPGTILGAGTDNQITRLFEGPFVLGLSGSQSPFVMIWDEDVAGVIAQGLRRGGTGVYNLAGDGTLSMGEIARLLGKRYVALPPWLVRAALAAAKPLRLSRYGPEQVPFLRYRPVLSNRRLKQEFGYRPRKTTREVFETFLAARRKRS